MPIAGFDYLKLEFDTHGRVARPRQRDAIVPALAGEREASDLLVLSHGWNNDMAEAEQLYAGLLENLRAALGADDRRIVVLGVLWPSKRFADEDLIPGGDEARTGAAAAGSRDLSAGAIRSRLDELAGFFEAADADRLDAVKAAIDGLDDDLSAQRRFAEGLRELVGGREAGAAEDDGADLFFDRRGDDLLAGLRAPLRIVDPPRAEGGAAGLGDGGPPHAGADARGAAAGLGSAFSGMKAAAWRLLNYATYYQMKKRAGVVGSGLNQALGAVRRARPELRIHLAGHSFGARAVTAAVDGPDRLRASSLILLQGAFSHHGLTPNFRPAQNGVFHHVVSEGKVEGPIAVTHTVNDRAVGVAYAIASRLAGDQRASLGGPDDPFGGIGRNGALGLSPERAVAADLGPPGARYALPAGKVVNLRADRFIAGHSDVANAAVASLAAAAILR